ncbi:MAG: hypothetical protein A2Z30_07210 [Chloroflexi bacterium RBG_16_64_43]|nr:MAG: hypothetical protein A2Z30_07210 [Chloroflexi bacterium RBG_16_64_43]
MRGLAGWGWLLILAGTLLFVSALGLLPFGLSRYEPLVLPLLVVAAGVAVLIRSARHRRGIAAGVVLVAAGAFWGASRLGLVRDAMFWPILLIALGLALVFQPLVMREG